MIGSRQGWIEAPYVACPVDLAGLGRDLVRTPGGELAIVYCFVFLYFWVAGGGAWSLDRLREPASALSPSRA